MLKKLFSITTLILTQFIFSQNLTDLLGSADENYFNQNYYKAIDLYKEVLVINSADLNSNFGLSMSLYMIGEYDEALLYIDRAIELDIKDLELINFKARILTALGRYSDSYKLYREVIEKEPYNINAQSGLAELRIVDGDIKGSLKSFEDILKFSPHSRRLILSLVVLNDKLGNYNNSDTLIQSAIKNYPKDPVVLREAVNHYIVTGNYLGAGIYMDELLNISSSSENYLLKGKLEIYQKRYKDAINYLNRALKGDKENPEIYYLIALSMELSGEKERAIDILKRGVGLEPENELYRFYLEKMVNSELLLKDERRREFSNWYLEMGQSHEDLFFYDKANSYYLRGIDIDPLNWDLRVKYSQILKKRGLRESYIDELKFLVNEFSGEKGENSLEETLLIEESLPGNPLFNRWEKKSSKNSFKYQLSLSVTGDGNSLNSNRDQVFMDVVSRFFSGRRGFNLISASVEDSFSNSFKSAREKSSDFFITLDFYHGERTTSLRAKLYLTKSGREIREFTYLKSGNDRIFNTINNLVRDIEGTLTPVGTIIDISGDRVLMDIGLVDGVLPENLFYVVKKGSISIVPEENFIGYEDESYLGKITIDEVAEGVSAGIFESATGFNLINIGDNTVLTQEENGENQEMPENSLADHGVIEQLLRVY